MNLFGNYVNLFVGHDTREPLNKLAFEYSVGLSGDFEGMNGQPSD
jgi:hypothetical protein